MAAMHLVGSLPIPTNSLPWGLATLSLAVVLGLILGAIRVGGIRLGVGGVLFSSLLFGQLGLAVDEKVLEFLRSFALIVFMYALGLQVGPGFLTSLRSEGVRLNMLSIGVVVLGAVLAGAFVKVGHLPRETASGLYSGAFTTTPGLAAGQEALRHTLARLPNEKESAQVAAMGLAYTVTYPFGLVGPMLVIAMLRRVFKVKLGEELKEMAALEEVRRPPIESMDFEVTQESLAGITLRDNPLFRGTGVLLSRLLRGNQVSIPDADTQIRIGDVYRAVGPRTVLSQVVTALGRPSTVNLGAMGGDIQTMDLVVTRTQVLRRSLAELNLKARTGVAIARITRSGIEIAPKSMVRLQFGDRVRVVGPAAGLKMVELELGNSPDTLNRPQLIPIFLGIVLGVVVGSVPLVIPGMRTHLRIGLAGGPLIAAIALSQLGNIGSVVWYLPVAANQLFRDFGLAVFLACVGLRLGDHFVQTVIQSGGLVFVGWGAALTVVPVFVIACMARLIFKMNFVTLCGWVAGAMTSSPALSFATELTGSDTPTVAYAAVAPLGMLTPILCSQLLVAFLM
jgi:putative transport protein